MTVYDYYIFGNSIGEPELRWVWGPVNCFYGKDRHPDAYKRMIVQGIADGVVVEPGMYIIVAIARGRPVATSFPIMVEDTDPPPPPKSTLRVV